MAQLRIKPCFIGNFSGISAGQVSRKTAILVRARAHSHTHTQNYTIVALRKIRHQSNFALAGIEDTYDQIYVCMMGSSLNQTSCTFEPDRPQHDHPTTCLIAQQYSSGTCVTLRSHSRNEKFGARFKNVII